MVELQRVQVNVPQGRLAEFHLMFGAWLVEKNKDTPEVLSDKWDPDLGIDWKTEQNEDFPKAYKLWGQLSKNARDIFTLLLMLEGADVVSTTEIADRVGLRSPAAVAGALTWPARYSNEMGRPLPVQWDKDVKGETQYWIPGVYVNLFKLVKQFHEAPSEKQAAILEKLGFSDKEKPSLNEIKHRLKHGSFEQ